MNVLFVSQCSKKALLETRRILDQFAERFGSNTWQTPITEIGLDTVRKLLRKTARKNTAVACHWIRSKNHTELLWIVGARSQFNEKGRVPTNFTEEDVLRDESENDWRTLPLILVASVIASLFHDFGKAWDEFQKKLKEDKKTSEAYRHEWISLRLFEAFVRTIKGNKSITDEDWLIKLKSLKIDISDEVVRNLVIDGMDKETHSPLQDLPHFAQMVGWLIVSHHFLPRGKPHSHCLYQNFFEELSSEHNQKYQRENDEGSIEKKASWRFSKKTTFSSNAWRKSANVAAERALELLNQSGNFQEIKSDVFSLHVARLSLILADHYYSNQSTDSNLGDREYPLYANTRKELHANKKATRVLNQRLDEHLIGVASEAKKIVRRLPFLGPSLPRISQHKNFKERSKNKDFQWQDKAYDLAVSIQKNTEKYGFFGVNMASTGCGKTWANGRVMYALADSDKGARFSIALGLRTLTLQTGQAYRERLKLSDDDVGIVIGSKAVTELFDLNQVEKKEEERKDLLESTSSGSESSQDLISDLDGEISYEGLMELDEKWQKWLKTKNDNVQKLLIPPILVCTVDHLIGATEGVAGGKQIIPMLRLLTSDLVLDEPDDFGMGDLPALSRLVHWAGMLGSRVLLSSATLPPSMTEGLFQSYLEGRRLFQKARGTPGEKVNICCAWFDENDAVQSQHADLSTYENSHNQFINRRAEKLSKGQRKAEIKPILQQGETVYERFAYTIQESIYELHSEHHSIDPNTQKKVSFGLVRFSNINPLVRVAQSLLALGGRGNHRLYICCYHSQHLLLIRSQIENKLDQWLDRKQPEKIFEDKDLRKKIDAAQEENLIFIVLATPVAEVGRDHDYDWAIVEPSSMRSIIQLAGRVRRHRKQPLISDKPNIHLLNQNIKALEKPNEKAVFCKPGFEKVSQNSEKEYLLKSHELEEILLKEDFEGITSRPRIIEPAELNHTKYLVDLEHKRLRDLMFKEDEPIQAWVKENSEAHLTGQLQRNEPFRKADRDHERYGLLLEDENDEMDQGYFYNLDGPKPVLQDSYFKKIELSELAIGARIEPMMSISYREMLVDLSEKLNKDLKTTGKQFGWVELRERKDGGLWAYNLVFGCYHKGE